MIYLTSLISSLSRSSLALATVQEHETTQTAKCLLSTVHRRRTTRLTSTDLQYATSARDVGKFRSTGARDQTKTATPVRTNIGPLQHQNSPLQHVERVTLLATRAMRGQQRSSTRYGDRAHSQRYAKSCFKMSKASGGSIAIFHAEGGLGMLRTRGGRLHNHMHFPKIGKPVPLPSPHEIGTTTTSTALGVLHRAACGPRAEALEHERAHRSGNSYFDPSTEKATAALVP
mmetsp:Transcript_1215/g.3388  ORF Transcript_1215/g.3388 Transcript_1215/m.3388 type:complete len:230 (+) Transcript_1215:53-742(+)